MCRPVADEESVYSDSSVEADGGEQGYSSDSEGGEAVQAEPIDGPGCAGDQIGEPMRGPARDGARPSRKRPRPGNGPKDDALMRDACESDCASASSMDMDRSPAKKRRELCWLCTFCTHMKAKQISSFIEGQVPHMSLLHIAEQVKHEILSEYPDAFGARKRDIIRHMQFHMLAPQVRMAAVLRSLISLGESIRLTILTRDLETDEVIIDGRQTELYLKVLHQVQSAYKMDSSKMIFSEAQGGSGVGMLG